MDILTNQIQRQVLLAALTEHKALAQSTAAACKRLHIDERQALESIGANDAINAALKNIPTGEPGEVALDLTITVIRHARAILSLWCRAVTRRSDQLELLRVSVNKAPKVKAAEELLHQLEDRLNMPQMALTALFQADDERAKQAKKRGKTASAAPTVRPEAQAPDPDRIAGAPKPDDAEAEEVKWDEGAPNIDSKKVRPLALAD